MIKSNTYYIIRCNGQDTIKYDGRDLESALKRAQKDLEGFKSSQTPSQNFTLHQVTVTSEDILINL